jgi:hypothetical protein
LIIFACVCYYNYDAKCTPLKLEQWTFYVVSTNIINEKLGNRRTVSIPTLEKNRLDQVRIPGNSLCSAIGIATTCYGTSKQKIEAGPLHKSTRAIASILRIVYIQSISHLRAHSATKFLRADDSFCHTRSFGFLIMTLSYEMQFLPLFLA